MTQPTSSALARDHREVGELLASVQDVLAERALTLAPPAWCERRGWSDFLAALSDAEVDALERDGVALPLAEHPGVPASLAELAREAHRAAERTGTALPPTALRPERGVGARKARQLEALLAQLEPLARGCTAVVEVGSGHGHLARAVAQHLGLEVLGLELNSELVATARGLARGTQARFEVRDARSLEGTLWPDELVLGLHCCGVLSDVAVRAAAKGRAPVAVVACCPQKRRGSRAPLRAPEGLDAAALTLGHTHLGLANQQNERDGVEESLEVRTRSREQRIALRALLSAEGLTLEPGEEMRGLNRRRATRSFEALVEPAFTLRGLAVPGVRARESALEAARGVYARARRFALPRSMFARALEVWLALDRAAWLEAQGYEAWCAQLFEAEASPRNLLVAARPG